MKSIMVDVIVTMGTVLTQKVPTIVPVIADTSWPLISTVVKV